MNKQQRIAMKLALEALEYIHEGANNQGPHTGISWRCVSNKVEPAITAIKEALAQPKQEPVATLWQHGRTGRTRITMPGGITDCDADWFIAADLYTSPPQRTWVGLTDEKIDQGLLRSNYALQTAVAWRDGVEWAIKQLKEKNT